MGQRAETGDLRGFRLTAHGPSGFRTDILASHGTREVSDRERDQSALFDAAQAVRAFARLFGVPTLCLIDEAEWDEMLCWQPSKYAWSALEHAELLADMLDDFGDCLTCLFPHDQPDREHLRNCTLAGWEYADPKAFGAVRARLSLGAERLARLLEGSRLGEASDPPELAMAVDLVVTAFAEEAVRDGSYHLFAAQEALEQAARQLLDGS